MGDILNSSSDWLLQKQKGIAAQDVVYSRDDEEVTVKAIIGRTSFDLESETGAVERVESRDYIIQCDDLILNGVKAKPKRGDKVYEIQGEKKYVYLLLNLGNEPSFRFSDLYRKAYRIHTKLVDTRPEYGS